MPYFSHALEAENVAHLTTEHFTGKAAQSDQKAVDIR